MKTILAITLLVVSQIAAAAADIQFKGFTWQVKEGVGPPGPNHWASDNVELTPEGMKFTIKPGPNGWTAGYATTTQKIKYGKITITVKANFDNVDDLICFSPYLYPDKADGQDGTQEIDIVEFSHWGRGAPLLNFTQWPLHPGAKAKNANGHVPPGTRTVTVTMNWTPTKIEYSSSTGASMVITDPAYVSNVAMPLKFNIRFVRGVPANPNSGPYSVVITSIKYEP